MECSEVQKRLSAYRESAVPPAEKALIDEHLKGCERCSEALAELERTIAYVQGLGEVEPPPWLTQKVMARVRAEAEGKRSLLRRLFYPIQIKLPLEAVAVVLVAVAVIYVFKAAQPEMRIAKAPIETEEAVPHVSVPEKEKAPVRDKGTPAPAAKPAEQFTYKKGQETRAEEFVEAAKAPAEIAKQDETTATLGAVEEDGLKREAAPSKFRAKAVTEKKGEDVQVRVDVKDIKTGVQEVEKVLVQLGGRVISTESFDGRAVIFATLSPEKITELHDALNLVGEVEEEERVFEDRKEDIRARIELEEIPNHP